MPNPINVPITPPRVAFIDPRTGTVAREWYMFFLSLFTKVDGSTVSLDDLQKATPPATVGELDAFIQKATEDLSVHSDDAGSEIAELKKQVEALSYAPIAALNQIAELTKQIEALEYQPIAAINQIAELKKQVEALELGSSRQEFKRCRYGQFYDTTTQTAALINTPYAITYDSTDISNGVYLGSPTSRIYVDEASLYNFAFSIELDKTSGGAASFWIWPRINGTDVPNSASLIHIQGNNAELFTSANFFLNLAAGDYVEFMFAVDDVSVELTGFPASAFCPAIPSIIVTVSDNVKGVQ